MTGPCPECGHDPSSDELERRCEQLEEDVARFRALAELVVSCDDPFASWRLERIEGAARRVLAGGTVAPSSEFMVWLRETAGR